MREETNYDAPRISGHAPYPKAGAAENWRLTSLAGTRVLDLIIIKALGRRVAKDQPFLEVTEPLSTAQIAELTCLEIRTVERELKDLETRKVIAVTRIKKGVSEFQPLFRTWKKLPDYKAGPIAEPEPEEEANPMEREDQAKDATVTQVTIKPVKIAAGKPSKAVKVDCGVTALRFSANVDAECSAVVQGGVLLVTLEHKWEAANGIDGLKKTNEIEEKIRHHRRIYPGQTEGKGTKGERRSKGEQIAVKHPRAEELSALFDPLVHRWTQRTLSGDPSALLKACEAIGDTPHDYLVKIAVERGSRTLTPLHVPSLCKQITHDWEKSKGMPPKEPGRTVYKKDTEYRRA
jgi:hypothetical protein